ncbi:MAG: alpha/beta fold hydrolase [Rhodospirillaceae bacterium]
MADCMETKIDVRGCEVFLRRGGKGEPLLFLHGAGGIPGWIPAFQGLADRFDLLVPDHPSFGQSDQPDWLDDMNDLAMFYLDFLDTLDLDGVHLVGQSLGGWLALEIAVRNSARLKSLTLVGSAGIRIKGKPIADIFMMDPDDLTRALFCDPSHAERILGMSLTEEQIDVQIRNRVSTARLGWQPRLFNPSLRKWLHRITVPVHVVWGDSDRIIDPAYAGEFARVLKGAEVTMIEKAGHLPHIEQAGPFVSAVSGFISGRAA